LKLKIFFKAHFSPHKKIYFLNMLIYFSILLVFELLSFQLLFIFLSMNLIQIEKLEKELVISFRKENDNKREKLVNNLKTLFNKLSFGSFFFVWLWSNEFLCISFSNSLYIFVVLFLLFCFWELQSH